jgi:Ni,Fe-hydrogenase III large subunit/Ni,Fe-hydrogenase III component G
MNEHVTIRRGQSHLDAIRLQYGAAIEDAEWQTENQVTVTVALASLPEVVETLYYGREGWLATIVANDERQLNGHYALYYILSMEGADRCFFVVRALVPAHKPEFPSVTPRVPAMVWGEREVRDMFGLEPVGLPDQRRLVLPDDWPDDLYPLRKGAMDYRTRPMPAAPAETYTFINEKTKTSTEVPLGPLHITSDEPAHFRLFVDGERIIDADYRLFYVHRGMEKLAETRMSYNEVNFLTDRICGICGFTHSFAYSSAVERALGIDVPERAQFIRSVAGEVERLHSNLLNVGLACHFIGFDSGFMQVFRVREKAMTIAEVLTGARKTYALTLVGGVRRDIHKAERLRILELVAELRRDVADILDILMSTANLEARTRGVGRLDPKIARDFSPSGAVVRGSGFARDTRTMHPYGAYANAPVVVHTEQGCDVLSRVLVRVEDVQNSLDIIEYLIDKMPEGPVLVEGFSYIPQRFAIGNTEAPRGDDIHWVMLGDNQKLYRWRCRAPTYANWPVLRYMFRDNSVADAPLIVASIDPCYSCCDRMTVVDVRKETTTVVPMKELERWGRERKDSPLA